MSIRDPSSPLPVRGPPSSSIKSSYSGLDIFVDENAPYQDAHAQATGPESKSHHDAHAPSRRQSAFTAISSIPPSLPAFDDDPLPHLSNSPNVTRRHRPPFRSPSSVRALQQLDSPLASPRHVSRSGSGWWKDGRGSLDSRGDHDEEEGQERDALDAYDDVAELKRRRAPGRQYTRRPRSRTLSDVTAASQPTPAPQPQPPLILLHVSVLPSPVPYYTHAVLTRHAPPSVVHSYHLLRQRLSEVVLARGVLVAHPGEEYDLLEERLLEALELCTPRVTGCGHFLQRDEDYEEDVDDDGDDRSERTTVTLTPDDEDDADHATGTARRAICDFAHVSSSSSLSDHDGTHRDSTCTTCSRPLHIHPVAGGPARWSVNFFAANGLMRAGAWSAAWREMERVDVQIAPYMPASVRRALDEAMREREEALDGERRQRELEVEMLRGDVAAAAGRIEELEGGLGEARREMERLHEEEMQRAHEVEALREEAERAVQAEDIRQGEDSHDSEHIHQTFRIEAPLLAEPAVDIPLSRLVHNYVLVLAQDKRNIAIAALSLLVLVLSFFMGSGSSMPAPAAAHAVHSTGALEALYQRNVAPMVPDLSSDVPPVKATLAEKAIPVVASSPPAVVEVVRQAEEAPSESKEEPPAPSVMSDEKLEEKDNASTVDVPLAANDRTVVEDIPLSKRLEGQEKSMKQEAPLEIE